MNRTALLTALSTVLTAAAVAVPGPAFAGTSTLENQVVSLTNKARAKGGCAPLRASGRLRTAARAHSADMARTGVFSHTGSGGTSFTQRAREAGYAKPAAENIAWGYRTPTQVVDSWMKSTVHRRNILTCSASTVGVGLAKAKNGTAYWTQVFGA